MKDVSNDPLNTLPNEECLHAGEICEDVKDSVKDSVAKLKTVRDQMLVRLHLAGLEAKTFGDEWAHRVDELSHRLERYVAGVDTSREHSQVQWHLGVMEAKELWEQTQADAQHALQVLKTDRDKAKRMFEELRLQMKLAKSDTQDRLDTSKEALSKNLREVHTQSIHALKRMNDSINDLLHRLH